MLLNLPRPVRVSASVSVSSSQWVNMVRWQHSSATEHLRPTLKKEVCLYFAYANDVALNRIQQGATSIAHQQQS